MPPLLPRRVQVGRAVVLAHPTPAFPQRPRGRHPQVSNEATAGFAARCGLRDCARPPGRARQGTWCCGLPLTPPSSYLGGLPTPRAGLPPASLTVSTACGRCHFRHVVIEGVRHARQLRLDPPGVLYRDWRYDQIQSLRAVLQAKPKAPVQQGHGMTGEKKIVIMAGPNGAGKTTHDSKDSGIEGS